ncbi:MAG TPA: hypothetical protein VM186_14980 [Planctomycetota bacterium]|nr:hypothetical protein [Planctomycetota bacterium]
MQNGGGEEEEEEGKAGAAGWERSTINNQHSTGNTQRAALNGKTFNAIIACGLRFGSCKLAVDS